ncbi:MAG TPA: hypothetical protein VID50_11470, partial [Candidatus Eisenbacteria bacterium]
MTGSGLRNRLQRWGAAAVAVAALAAGAPAAAGPGSGASSQVWIFFRDRGEDGKEAPEGPTPRALARRARAARERAGRGEAVRLDPDADREIDGAYVLAVEAAGAAIRTRSRWLNAVSADADSAALATIRAFPFV